MNVYSTPGSGLNSSFVTPGSSPLSTTAGVSATTLRRLVYHERWSALPWTTSSDFLITTECTAVTIELVTPYMTPRAETCVPSMKTPTKKPNVTSEHASRIRSDGRACRKSAEVPTVKGSTSPRATW